ncbi:MAG: helix-turn-helix transcriptional regulator [Candidatus Cloacimonadales bacterium]
MENQDTILSIGQYLATARNNKGLTLEEVSEKTKIKLRLLQAVEKNNFEDFGGVGYTKAIIDTYAKAVEAKDAKLQKLINDRFASKITHQAHFDNIQPKRILIPKHFWAIVLLVILVIIMIITTVQLTRAGIIKSPLQRSEKKSEQTVEPQAVAEPETKVDEKKEKIQEKKSDDNPTFSIKPKMLQEAAELQASNQKSSKPVILSETALRDTTDYLKKLMFNDKANPFL